MEALRRHLSLVATLALLPAACAPAAPASPTAALAKPAVGKAEGPAAEKPAPKPTEKPAAKAAEKPADRPAARPAAKALPADSFAGKTITFVVPLSAGGPTDVFARLLIEPLAAHIPGKPTIIVENKTGAGGRVGMNHVSNAATKDGTVIEVFTSSFSHQIIEAEGVQFDASKFLWLGGVAESQVGFAHKNLGAKEAKDLLSAREIIVGGLSPSNTKDMAERTFFNMLGLKYKYVTGFSGNADARAAFLRGEINYFEESLTGWFSGIVPLVNEGTAFPIGQPGIIKGGRVVRDPRGKDIPTCLDAAEELKGDASRRRWTTAR